MAKTTVESPETTIKKQGDVQNQNLADGRDAQEKPKRLPISALSTMAGKEIESFYVLKSPKAGLTEKAEWINAVFEDQSGSVDSVIWKEAIPPNIRTMVGQVVKVRAKVGIRNGMMQLAVKELSLVPQGEFELSDFAPGLSNEQIDELKKKLEAIIASVRDPKLNCLLKTAFTPAAVRALAALPGGHSHHVYNGGLLVHTIEVASLTDELILADTRDAKYHLHHVPVNRDIAITGALLHDIGKGKEFVPFPFNKRRENSYFVGFPTAGAMIIEGYVEKIEKANRDENGKPKVLYGALKDILQNIACACHVTYRDCVPPRTKEAIFVRLADKMSADRDVVDTDLCEFIEQNPDEEPGMIYSEYFRCSITVDASAWRNSQSKDAKGGV